MRINIALWTMVFSGGSLIDRESLRKRHGRINLRFTDISRTILATADRGTEDPQRIAISGSLLKFILRQRSAARPYRRFERTEGVQPVESKGCNLGYCPTSLRASEKSAVAPRSVMTASSQRNCHGTLKNSRAS